MELVLEGVDSAPEGAVLSLKIGDTRRQAPLSKIGQSFKFSSSPAEALPVSIDVLVPAAKPQSIMLDPLQESFVVDFAGTRIRMRQQAAPEYQRAVPNVGDIAANRGLSDDKKDQAAQGAAYLEKHGLVRTFQDLLHGLLVLRPDDPWGYLDEAMARAKAVSTQAIANSPPTGADPPPKSKKGKSQQRGSIASRSKVDALMEILVRTKESLPLILPYLPPDMGSMLISEELANECQRQFEELDVDRVGKLGPEELLPVIVQLSTAKEMSVGSDQCRKFTGLFDANEDGYISLEEFTELTQFVIVAAHLETDEGKDLLNQVQAGEDRFAEFIDVLIQDKDKINDIVPFLPDWLVQHVTSDEFLDDCMNNFDALDTDKNDALSPDELVPIIANLTRMNALNMDKCKEFVAVFDVHKNGVIMRDEFLEFAQFLAVTSFLSSSVEGQQVGEAAMFTAEMRKTDELIASLENDVANLPQVITYLPASIADELNSEVFKKECVNGFVELDTNGNGSLDPAELFPLVQSLCEGHPMNVDIEACKAFTAIFDKDRNGVISFGEFTALAQLIITMGYLHFTREWRESTVSHSKEKIEALLQLMKNHCDRLDEILPLLPNELQDDLMGMTFMDDCLEYFDSLDTDRSGSLEPKELVPVVLDLCKAHPFALSRDQCLRFVDIFDTEQTGMLSRNEFVNFSRFMMIMSYLETEEGQVVQDFADIAVGEKKVDELIAMLTADRNAVKKVLCMLPDQLYDDLTNDGFIQKCRQRFIELDADGNGVLSPMELFPLIVELSAAHPYSIDEEQCERFAAIFDSTGAGVIRLDEFLDFMQFLEIMAYMNSDTGKQEFAQGLQIIEDNKTIESLISNLERDRSTMKNVIPYLPEEFREQLLSESFTLNCLERFKDLDADGSDSLDPTELYPIIMDMTNAASGALDIDQCKRFTAIFDDSQTGLISQREFVNFARFLMVMSFLQTEDGQSTLEIALNQSDSRPVSRGAAAPAQGFAASGGQVANLNDSSVSHLNVDLDYYQQKADKLSRENQDQRQTLLGMEEKMRVMEERMELQERKLRHAAVDLNGSR